jgi:hypothetical protein
VVRNAPLLLGSFVAPPHLLHHAFALLTQSADFPGQTLLPTIEDILLLNVTNGSFITTDNIQGDIL